MEVEIKVVAEDIRTKQARHVKSCFFTMAAVDDERRPSRSRPWNPRRAMKGDVFMRLPFARKYARNSQRDLRRSAPRMPARRRYFAGQHFVTGSDLLVEIDRDMAMLSGNRLAEIDPRRLVRLAK
jgi:acyl-CoA hydrolase